MAMALEHQVALVTGAGSGLGAALATALVGAGARVLLADCVAGPASHLAAQLREQGGVAEAAELDVRDPEAARAAVDSALARWGRIDILINNAGTDCTRPVHELNPADWRRVLETNLHGPFYLARAVLEPMRTAGAGHIVNICSTAAKRAWPQASAYHASKWGLLGLSHALHAELREQGIRVTAVITGGMRTPFLLDRFPDLDPARLQDPADVAQAILGVLAMPAASVVAELTVVPPHETSWP